MKRMLMTVWILLALLCPLTLTAETLVEAHCDVDGYTIKIPADTTTSWEDTALYIWLGEYNYVPNIYITRRMGEWKLKNPDNYVRNVVANDLKETYGSNLMGTTIYETYEIGGKKLLGAAYIYKAPSGNVINQLLLVEIREDGDVEYCARYLNSEKERTLSALEAAVRTYQPDTVSKGGSGKKASAQTAPTASGSGKQLKTAAVKPVISGTKAYGDGRFTMNLPTGWQILTQSDYMSFCFKSWDPSNPNRTLFMFMKLEPFIKSWEAKQKYQAINNGFGGKTVYAPFADAPVLQPCSLEGFLAAIPQVRQFCEKYYASGLSISPSVIPSITGAKIVEKMKSTLPAPATCRENSIARITYQDDLGQPCEGLVTAQPTDNGSYYFEGVDGAPLTVYLFMGVTTPIGEMKEAESALLECLGSFAFTQNYVKQAIGLSTSETQALLQQGRQMQAAHDAMVSAWYAREQSHDIAFQKWSDSFMGYDRLYDSSTGEVYLADVGFYDTYDLHRGEYANSNLQIVDSRSEQYYLQGADYYITK